MPDLILVRHWEVYPSRPEKAVVIEPYLEVEHPRIAFPIQEAAALTGAIINAMLALTGPVSAQKGLLKMRVGELIEALAIQTPDDAGDQADGRQ